MVNNKTVLDFFRCRIDTLSIHSIRDYSKTIALLSDFVPEAANTLVSPSVALLENWCMYLMNSGMTVKTVAHHVDVVSGLYRAAVAAGVVMPSDVFTTFRTRIREFESARHFKSISETDYNRLHSLICNRTKLPLQEAMLTEIFVISLLTGGMSPTDIALLKKETINLQSSTVISILAHYQENKRKYIFPLAQSELTRKQLERNITTGITGTPTNPFKSYSVNRYTCIVSLHHTQRSYLHAERQIRSVGKHSESEQNQSPASGPTANHRIMQGA